MLNSESNYYFYRGLKIDTLDDCYEASMIIPGAEREEIHVTASSNLLEVKSSNTSYPYEYKLKLSKLVDIEKISSSLKNGVLKIKLPKQKSQTIDLLRIPVS